MLYWIKLRKDTKKHFLKQAYTDHFNQMPCIILHIASPIRFTSLTPTQLTFRHHWEWIRSFRASHYLSFVCCTIIIYFSLPWSERVDERLGIIESQPFRLFKQISKRNKKGETCLIIYASGTHGIVYSISRCCYNTFCFNIFQPAIAFPRVNSASLRRVIRAVQQ